MRVTEASALLYIPEYENVQLRATTLSQLQLLQVNQQPLVRSAHAILIRNEHGQPLRR
jgi:hypothetical protein